MARSASLELATEDGRPLVSETWAQSPFAVRGLTVAYGETPAVFSVDLTIPPQAMAAIIGPNGAGKSTLLKAALGVIPKVSGHATHFGEDLSKARGAVAYVPQRASVDWEFPARAIDVVLMGLSRELGLLRPLTQAHRSRALECLERVGMSAFAERQIGRLSGGQQQRVFLARALAQDAALYLLDEPFAGVDAATETAIVSVLKGLKDEGKTVVAVHHDLSTAAEYFDHVCLINRRLIAEGPMREVFTAEALRETYGGQLAEPAFTRLERG